MIPFSIFNKWRSSKKTEGGSKSFASSLYPELFQFLIRQITVPRNAEQLIQLGHKAHNKKPDEIFHIYLLFEKYISSFEPEQKYTSQSLRQEICRLFPDLIKTDPFSILFLSDVEKKNTIACHFLADFLSSVSIQFGHAGDGFFEKKLSELDELKSRISAEQSFRDLQFLSFEIFHFVHENYGSALAGKIFERCYEKLSAKYKELEVFPHLVTLIPKEIVKREHLGIFTQSQIEQVFLDKLAETEKLNIALDQKIREQENTQKLLANNEAMLSSVISSALDAIVMTDSKGMVIQWNEAASEIFGFTAVEIIGKNVFGTLILESELPLSEFNPQRFFKNPNNKLLNRRFEVICNRKCGTPFSAEFTITSFRNKNEYFFNGFVRDISIPKQREQELVRTKERAEQAARAKSQFLSVMSHEIRTPLNAIIGFTELLLQNTPREDQLEDLRMLKFSGENLLNIINDILDFNKLDSGKVQLSFVSFNLRELTQSLYQSFSYKAKEKKIVFDVEYDEKMPFVIKGDSLRISQILNNLVSNAIKFTSTGSVTLKVHLEESLPDGFKTRFSVIDTGIGIPADKQQTIFDQFTQADSDTTRLFGGTGLGRSISGKLAELMGSRIEVQSEPGKGANFSFSLKLLFSDEDQPKEEPKSKSKKSVDAFAGKKILLAEDNQFNANIARRYIKGWGAEMDLALDGQQALEFALRNKYDLILMDVQMPVLDGFACCRSIRKYHRELPIIAITAAPINEVIDEIKKSGMNDQVSKPFKPSELFEKLERYMGMSNKEQ